MVSATFHVFLSHNSADKPAVEELAKRLKADGIESWLDKWHLIPGEPWQQALEQALEDSKSVAVIVGPTGFGPWQNEEMRAALAKRVSDSDGHFRVIPVLLPGATREERSRLPAFLLASTWVEFRKSLDDEEAYHRLKSGILGRPPGLLPGDSIYEGQCPYRGLQAFQPEHAPFFFGREARMEWLLNALRPARAFDAAGMPRENRFLAIVGASGSGKSSLARAGLVPALRAGKLEGSETWPIIICRPGHDPLESLAVALAGDPAIGPRFGDVADFISKMESDETRLHLATRIALGAAPESQRVVVVVDQFEEIFTLHSDDMSNTRASRSFRDVTQLSPTDVRRKAFINNLIYAAGIAGGKTIVILTMRADFYSKCAMHPHLAAAVTDHQELVGPMSKMELREVIEQPAQLVGLELEPGLTEMLLSDMEHQPGALPLLQHALWELWQRRDGRKLTVSAYQAMGGLEGALEQQANTIFDGMSAAEQETCRRIFLRLTQPGEGSEDTKRRVAMSQLGDSAAISAVINRLTNVRLITAEKDSFVEVSHEALIRSWSKLRNWIEADREALRTQHRLTEATAEWKESHRNAGYLYQGARLAEAEEWSKTPEADLTVEEREFLAASVAQRDSGVQEEAERRAREVETLKKLAEIETQRAGEQTKAAQRSRSLSRAALGLAAVAMVAFFWAAKAQREAKISQRQAENEQQQAIEAQRLAETNAKQTEEARHQIEETLASNLCERIHVLPGLFGVGEFDAFWQIADLPDEREQLRMRLLSMGFEKRNYVDRLINRAPNIAQAIIGLKSARRETALKHSIQPILDDPSSPSPNRLAAVRLGIALKIDGVDFAEQAVRSLSGAMVKYDDPSTLEGLANDLMTAIRVVPTEDSEAVLVPLVDAMQQTDNARVLRRLCDAAGSLPGQMSAVDGRRVADRLITVLEKESRPEAILQLSSSLSSLPTDLKEINPTRGTKYVIKAIESTMRSDVHDSLVGAVETAVKRLNATECRATADELLTVMKRIQYSEYGYAFARCLKAVAVRLAESDTAQAIDILIEGMKSTQEADPLRVLCSGLGQLPKELPEASRRIAVTRLLEVMGVEESSRDLRLLAESLAAVPGTLSEEEIAKAKSSLFDFFANPAVDPPDVQELTSGLAALPANLTMDESDAVYKAIVAALGRVQRTQSIRSLGAGLEALGSKLTPESSAPIVEFILTTMKETKDEERLLALAQSFRGMEKVVDEKKIANAYQTYSSKLQEPRLIPINLCLLAECLAVIPDDIPQEIANDAINRMLQVLESTENSDVVLMVVDKLGLVGGDVSSAAGQEAISKILERIRNTREVSLYRALCLGLAAISTELVNAGKFTKTDATTVTDQLVKALDVTTEANALIRLGLAIEKIAPYLPENEQETTRHVIEQNLKSIEATRNPVVIAQYAKIWQAMAERMTQQETHDAFEKILEVNLDSANKEVRPALCKAAVSLATAADSTHAKDALWHLLVALRREDEDDVLEIILNGIETMSLRIPASDVKEAKAILISTTGDHDRINEHVLNRLIKALDQLPDGISLIELVNLLKSPFCTGHAQQSVMRIIERMTGMNFDGNPWKFVRSAKEVGINPSIFSDPVKRPDSLFKVTTNER